MAPGLRAGRRRAGGDRRDRAPARRAARWPSSWPPPGCTRTTSPRWPPGSTTASRCCRPGYRTSARHGSLSAAVSWSFGLLDERPAADLRRPVGVRRIVHGRRRGGDLRRRRGDGHRRAAPARRALAASCGRPTAGSSCWRRCGRSAPSSSPPTAGPRRSASAMPATRSTGSSAADRRLRRGSGRGSRSPRSTPRIPELRAALGWLLDHDQVELAGRLVVALLDYGFLRLRPDVLAWAERVTDADPDDRSPLGAASCGPSRLRRVDGRRRAPRPASAAGAPCGRASGPAGDVPPRWPTICGNDALFEGRLDEAVGWYRRAADAAADDPAQRLVAASTEVLALAYAGDPTAVERRRRAAGRGRRRVHAVRRLRLVLRRRGRPGASTSSGPGPASPGRSQLAERDERLVRDRARRRLEGVDRRPARRPARRRRGLPPADHPLAAGRDVVDAVDDAALDRRAAGPARASARRRRAGGRGAGDARRAPHLRRRRGRARPSSARGCAPSSATRRTRRPCGEGAALDGDAAVEHALRAL